MEVGLVRRFSKTRKQFPFLERLGLCGMMDRSLSHRFLYTSLRQNCLLQLLQIRKHSRLDDERNKFSVINYAPNRRRKHFTIVCLRQFVTTTWAASSRQSQHAETLLLHERFNLRFEPIYGKIPNEDDELSLQGKGCSSHAFLWRISDAGKHPQMETIRYITAASFASNADTRQIVCLFVNRVWQSVFSHYAEGFEINIRSMGI